MVFGNDGTAIEEKWQEPTVYIFQFISFLSFVNLFFFFLPFQKIRTGPTGKK